MKIIKYTNPLIKTSLQFFLLLAILVLNMGPIGTGTAYAAAPDNDNWSLTLPEPYAITNSDMPYSNTVSIDEATVQVGEPQVNASCDGHYLETGDTTVWYTFTSNTTKYVSFDTVGSKYAVSPGVYDQLDTYIAIWTGNSIGNLTLVGCDDDNDVGLTSQIGVNAQAGVTYYIQVAEYNGYQGHPESSECTTSGTFPDITGCTVTLNVKYQTFVDVPPTHPYFQEIEALYANGYTNGCNITPPMYCPNLYMNRAQIAKFFMTVQEGGGYLPPNDTPIVFKDNWKKNPWAKLWANDMKEKGLTSGCSISPPLYCPDVNIPRDQVAKFGLTMKYGNAYTPPAATGIFADVPTYWATDWIEQAYLESIIPDCGFNNVAGKPKFCPSAFVDRGLAAYVIATAKGLLGP